MRGAITDIQDLARKAKRDAENRARGVAARAHGSHPRQRSTSPLRPGMPERRLLEGGSGVLLALWGLRRGGLIGTGMMFGGLSLVARAAIAPADGAIRVQKTLTINAPVGEVYGFWSRFENFPRFMQHVLEVRPEGDGRSHWRVTGPANVPIEWDAEITERVDNRKIAWRSLEGSIVENHGEVHFEAIDEGTTRISVHMAYQPPAGAMGHAVAAFLHGDPKTLMDDDLLRMKTLLEQGKTTARHDEITRDQLR
jgi:uncharacterized membrane protein